MYSEARKYLEAAVAKEKTVVNQYHLAFVLGKLGQSDRAREYLRAAMQLDPKVARETQIP